MKYDLIVTAEQLDQLCGQLARASYIAFDTEFVSEDTYRPELCLVQVATERDLAVIDPYAAGDITPFWKILATGQHETIVHAGREEFRFCQLAVGQRPARLCDVQIGAGLIGLEYPAAYGTLVSRLAGKSLSKGETRTDWRKRPLTSAQLEYALQDVIHLFTIRNRIGAKLEERQRSSWLETEMESWQAELEAVDSRERWRRVSGVAGLSTRCMAIVRELWRWREAEAERRNQPPRRVLRDDLIVELARRQSADPDRIRGIRGMERGDLQRHMPALAKAIATALAIPDDSMPRSHRLELPDQITLLGQFLTTALGSLCRGVELAPALVGTAQDVRDLVAQHLGYWDAAQGLPALAQGWRKEVIGKMIDDLLDGKQSIFIRDPLADEPLAFEPRK